MFLIFFFIIVFLLTSETFKNNINVISYQLMFLRPQRYMKNKKRIEKEML